MAMILRPTKILTVIFGGAMSFGSSEIMAQTLGLEYTTEWQTDFKGGYDWLNLLKLSAEVPVYHGLSLEASTISTAKTGDNPLIIDRLTYSNIEAGNIPLTFARLGFGWEFGKGQLFVGINNVNEDYFISDMTSFFSNSSCGISPTISCNFDIANYPLASWCAHYSHRLGNFSAQTSLYPGQGYQRILGRDNLFNLNLKRDGIFSISSIDYKRNGIYCVLGIAMHYGHRMGDEDAESPMEAASAAPEKKFSAAPWILSEINLPHNLGLHLHGSFATVKDGCKGYAGAGVMYMGARVQPAVALNYARFSSASEYTAELGCRVEFMSGKAYIQPALHLVRDEDKRVRCVGMMRFNLNLAY